ncbi:MAG: diguanylate cyclase [Anaerolineae bacterium]|nr:diguanylate cyclase [Anaerolineae bacterium]
MARKSKAAKLTNWNILLVDDDQEYLEANRLLLKREGHNVLTAENGPDALEILKKQPIDLLLLDFFMPGMTGEEVVEELRKFNPFVQVILQTGYASEKPPREILRKLDIQGYFDKSEGPDKFLLWTDVGLKVAYTVQLLQKSRQGLQYILDVTPDLHKIQPLDDLLQGILFQVAGLLGATNSFLAVLPEDGIIRVEPVEIESFLALNEESELTIKACTGRFHTNTTVSAALNSEQNSLVQAMLHRGDIQIVEEHTTLVPLRVGENTIGLIYLDRPVIKEEDLELLQLFANQASVAIQNSRLYEMATLDNLTGVYVRGFFEQMARRELRTAFRSQQELSFLLLDIDDMKSINDTAGHIAGDEALRMVGKALRQVTRGSDIVGRYGGDEFGIILPNVPAEGAHRAGERLLEALKGQMIRGEIPLNVSIGAMTLEQHSFSASEILRPITQDYFISTFQSLIISADEALYEAKKNSGSQFHSGGILQWPDFS